MSALIYLDNDPAACARSYYDADLLTLTLRYAQSLAYVQRAYNTGRVAPDTYRHGRTKDVNYDWMRNNESNFNYLSSLFQFMCEEYQFRFEKPHPSERMIPFITGVPERLHEQSLTRVSSNRMRSYLENPFRPENLAPAKLSLPWPLFGAKYLVDRNNKSSAVPVHVSLLNSHRNYYAQQWDRADGNKYTKRELPTWLATYRPDCIESDEAMVAARPSRSR